MSTNILVLRPFLQNWVSWQQNYQPIELRSICNGIKYSEIEVHKYMLIQSEVF